jgi:predicted outer membrane protein
MSSIRFRRVVSVTSLVALVFSFNLLAAAQDQTTSGSTGQSKSNQQSGNTKQSGTDKQKNSRSGMNDQNTGNTAGQSGTATGSGSLADSDRKFVMETAHGGMAEVMLGRMASERASSDEVKRFGQRMVDDHTKTNQELMQLASTKGITMPAMTDMGGNMAGAGSGTDTTMSNTQTQTSGSQSAGSTGQTSGSQSTGSQSTGSQTSGTTDRTATGGQTSGSTAGMSGGGAGANMMDPKHQKLMGHLSGLSGAEFDREYMKQMVKDHEDAVSDFQKQSTRAKDPDIRAFAARTLPALQEHLRMAREIDGRLKGGSNTTTNKNNTSGDANSTTKRP